MKNIFGLIAIVVFYSCSNNTEKKPDTIIDWGTSPNFSKSWTMEEEDEYYEMFSITDSGYLQMARNSKGKHYIFQYIPVKKQTFYKVTAKVAYNIENYKPGGVYVTEPVTNKLLGQYLLWSAKGEKNLVIAFNSNENDSIALNIGFNDGIKGKMAIKTLTFDSIKYNSTKVASQFGNYLIERLNLSFSKEKFDSSVDTLCSYVNSILLAEYKKDSAAILKRSDFLKKSSGKKYRYLSKYLGDKNIGKANCQKSSLSLTDLLTDEFNIPVRQNHMQENGTGIHQFVEYWNPFREKWVMIDPMYAMRYQINNQYIGIDDLESYDPTYIKGLFYQLNLNSLENYRQGAVSLLEYWQRTTIDRKQSIIQTYPY